MYFYFSGIFFICLLFRNLYNLHNVLMYLINEINNFENTQGLSYNLGVV